MMTFGTSHRLYALVLTGAFLIASVSMARGGEKAPSKDEGRGRYQIVKASDNRVWRLDRETGEITVCTLDGPRLNCTVSSDAIRPPKVSFEENEAEKRRQEKEAQAKDLEFLDRALAAVRSLFKASIERDGAN
ncbi:hypothetical protein [Varunaivibrio sulfuroxidans]|uniref:Uncharacterized protein n=1 Tax=Varunaivibrio sulfuroxidans TaxID=1773489 RepID=A0A4R3JGV1_9PROT|nr:hypothetical protein [Varunaivibrio sulfuroxidans]TCS65174.1 hypothetical protein EDD55_101508 [Varunaivibrio sulfuroxidans]WES29544.1 hypothetical protein P3M64_07720 [Varunaivibrio sulfuroxidans]